MDSYDICVSYDQTTNDYLTRTSPCDPYKFRKSFLYSKNQVFQMNVNDDLEIIMHKPKPNLLTYIEATTELNKISNLNLDI